MIRNVTKGAWLLCACALFCIGESLESKESFLIKPVVSKNSWKEFHSKPGNCKIAFPDLPQHVSEKMAMPGSNYDLSYDAYISSLDSNTIFMLLVAHYPDFVDSSYAQMSLESFLNGLLSHNSQNQLIFAELSLFEGHQALDFFIRAGATYFKGRAFMVRNSLYLMAMECDVKCYDEVHFKNFVESFKFVDTNSVNTKAKKK